MRASDEDALFCDFLEYYGLHGFGLLPAAEEAALAASLPAESRIMRSVSGMRFSFDQLLLAGILDQLRVLNWSHTKDAKKKRNFPKSILDELIRGPEEAPKKDELETFESGEDLKRRLAEIRGD